MYSGELPLTDGELTRLRGGAAVLRSNHSAPAKRPRTLLTRSMFSAQGWLQTDWFCVWWAQIKGARLPLQPTCQEVLNTSSCWLTGNYLPCAPALQAQVPQSLESTRPVRHRAARSGTKLSVPRHYTFVLNLMQHQNSNSQSSSFNISWRTYERVLNLMPDRF